MPFTYIHIHTGPGVQGLSPRHVHACADTDNSWPIQDWSRYCVSLEELVSEVDQSTGYTIVQYVLCNDSLITPCPTITREPLCQLKHSSSSSSIFFFRNEESDTTSLREMTVGTHFHTLDYIFPSIPQKIRSFQQHRY